MSEAGLTIYTDQNMAPKPSKRLREAVADAYTFIRSQELNQAIATVTIEQLMGDQINRNGESARSNASKYDPYSYDPKKNEAASAKKVTRANFLGGVDTNRPTKLDRVLAIVNSIESVAKEIKGLVPLDVSKPEEYTDVASVAAPEET